MELCVCVSVMWMYRYWGGLRAHLAPRNHPRLLCNLEIILISKILKTVTVRHPIWRLVLEYTFWKLMVTCGNGLKLFLLLLFSSCNIFSHSLMLSYMVLIVTCMASVCSSPPDAWVEHLHHGDMGVQPKNTQSHLSTLSASPNVTTPQTTKKHAWPKPNGPQLKRWP